MHFYASNVAAELESKPANRADCICPCSVVESEKELNSKEKTEERCEENVAGEIRVV